MEQIINYNAKNGQETCSINNINIHSSYNPEKEALEKKKAAMGLDSKLTDEEKADLLGWAHEVVDSIK